MKTEALDADKQGLIGEISFLERLQGSPFFPQLITFGQSETHRYLVMELLGLSISNLRRSIKDRKFSLPTLIRLSIYMLKCIEAFHLKGLIHRDIKPGNFLIRNNNECPVVLIDYGLSKEYIDPLTNKPFLERPKSGFRGTSKYASINAHYYKDLSRRDDLLSWMYSVVELFLGKLPWSDEQDNNHVKRMKEATADILLFEQFPESFLYIFRYIQKLQFLDEPRYDLIIDILNSTLIKLNFNFNFPFDWENLSEKKYRKISNNCSLPNSKNIIPIPISSKNLNSLFFELDGKNNSQCCLLL